jgi:hypothetical protein
VDFVPAAMRPLIAELAPPFTRPTLRRFSLLAAAAILTVGRRTVANLLRRAGGLTNGEASGYRRVLSAARWSEARAGHQLARLVLALVPADRPVVLVGDDTVTSHPGPRVYGKARHRDPVRSTHGYTAWRWGHRWVVLAVLVRFPFAARPWALPVAVELYRTPADDRAEGRRHRTPAQLMRTLLALTLRRFPDRRFVFAGDSGFGTHELAAWVSRRRRLELVSKAHPDLRLYEPPPAYTGLGRPRVTGRRLPTPRQTVETPGERRHRLSVDWYGGGRREVSVVTGTGRWYKSGRGLAAIRWVHVRDLSGTHRDEYLYATADSLSPAEIIGLYCGRWNLETTFQEAREHLGFGTTRGRCRNTVMRAEPCLLCLYSVVAWLYARLPEEHRVGGISWAGKRHVAFSDAITAVRRRLWCEWVFPRTGLAEPVEKLPPAARELLLSALALAA